jgi:hypothetical protein
MTDGTSFSKLFVKFRKEAGFDTAYHFFHGNGGRKVFQCTFSNYLRIEKGRTLPPPKRLQQLAHLLRLPLKPQELRALVEAYLEAWTDSRETAEWVGQALRMEIGREAPPDPSSQALRKVVRQEVRPVSMKEYEAIIKDRASYWCYRVLAGVDAEYTSAQLAEKTGLPEKEIKKALDSLREAGFVRKEKNGCFRSPFAGRFLLFPDPTALSPELVERPLKYNKDMAAKNGQLLMVRHCGTRVDLDRFEGFLPYFREAVRSAQAYSTSESTGRTGLVYVEGRVYKTLDV